MDKELSDSKQANDGKSEIFVENGIINVRCEDGQLTSSDIFSLLLGVAGNESFNSLINQALESFNGNSRDENMNALLQFLQSISPNDALEGMLAIQMITTHNMSLEMVSRAMHPENSTEIISENINRSNRLMKTFATQLEALQKYRKKGQQTIQVQHVNVESGGQAIVGNIGGRGK